MARYSYVSGSERDELAVPSQRLIEAALSGDVEFVTESLKSKTVDVNYTGTVNLRVKCIETVLREEEADEIEIQYRDFVTDVTPLFAAAHSGHVEIARKLLVLTLFDFLFLFNCDCQSKTVDVNYKNFRFDSLRGFSYFFNGQLLPINQSFCNSC